VRIVNDDSFVRTARNASYDGSATPCPDAAQIQIRTRSVSSNERCADEVTGPGLALDDIKP